MQPYPSEPAPGPALNGGLYGGRPFPPDAPWRNFPAPPEAGQYMHGGALAAVRPPGAQHHVPGGGQRPGNNTPMLPPEVVRNATRFPGLSVVCAPDDAPDDVRRGARAAGSGPRGEFSAHYHI